MTTHSLIIFYRKMSESGEISHESIALSQYDILRRIFRSLPMKEVRRLASVCKIWNEVSFRLVNQAHDWCCQYPLLFCPQSVVMILAPRYASERGIHWRINREIDKSVYTKHPINMCEKNPISGKRSLSAQFEHTIGVTANGCEIFTSSSNCSEMPIIKKTK